MTLDREHPVASQYPDEVVTDLVVARAEDRRSTIEISRRVEVAVEFPGIDPRLMDPERCFRTET
jgi:hypothetical protein